MEQDPDARAESPSERERRGAPRQLSCIPAFVKTEEVSRQVAIIRDVSIRGALLFTRAKFAVDDDVALSLYISNDCKIARDVSGRVRRIERRTDDGTEVWPYEAGIEFDSPITEYEKEIEALNKRLEEEGVLG